MRYGLFVPQGWRLDLVGIDVTAHWDAMLDVVRVAEDGPFESIWVYDHFHTVPEPTDQATHEAWTLMAMFGAATRRVRLGQMCTCMGYRNPAYLAKVAATIDVLTQGRVEMGIGAGWYEHEWRAYGYGFPSAGDRIGQLDEGVQIMRELWRTGESTFQGRHYTAEGAICRPRPISDHGIPMWIAGGGERKTLRIAAQYADYTNFDGTLEGFRHKSEILAGHCRDLGRDFDEIIRSANYNVVIGRDQREVEDRLDQFHDRIAPYVSADRARSAREALASGPLVGTPDQIIERLRVLQDSGMTYAILYFAEAAYDRSGIDLFTEQVVPHV